MRVNLYFHFKHFLVLYLSILLSFSLSFSILLSFTHSVMLCSACFICLIDLLRTEWCCLYWSSIKNMTQHFLCCRLCSQLFQSKQVLYFLSNISILQFLWQVTIFFHLAGPLLSVLQKIVNETKLWDRFAGRLARKLKLLTFSWKLG